MILATPVMITQAGQILVNVVDNVMVGGLGREGIDSVIDENLGKTALASVSLGNAVFFMVMIFAFGFSFAMSPLVAAADAKGNKNRVAQVFSHGLLLNLALSVILFVFITLASPLVKYLGQPEKVIEQMIPYLSIVTFSMVPLMIFQSLRQFSEGLSLTIPIAVTTIIGNVLNIFLNYGLIYGHLGFPRLEIIGAAWGTFLVRVFMMVMLFFVLMRWKKVRMYISLVSFKFKAFNKHIMRKIINLGVPSALTSFFEVSTFAIAAFVIGYTFSDSLEEQLIAEANLAAHQIANNLASISFMMCVGLGVASTIRVGNQLGLKNYKLLREAGWSTIILVSIFMFTCGILIITFRYQLPKFYNDNVDVVNIAAKLLIVAAFFQLSDGIQLVALGSLRGMQDVRVPSVITFVSYWIVALPLGALLAIYFEMRAFGMWIGLGIGLTLSAILLLLRYHTQTKKLTNGNS